MGAGMLRLGAAIWGVKPDEVLAGGGAWCGGKVEFFAPSEYELVGLGRSILRSSNSKARYRYTGNP